MAHPIDSGIVSLYKTLKPDEIDLNQLGTPSQVPDFEKPAFDGLRDLASAIDFASRQDRYAANLAYALAIRVGDNDDSVESPLQELGTQIVDRVGAEDPAHGEQLLRTGLRRLMTPSPSLTDDIIETFVNAFKGALDVARDASGNWSFTGAAAETATMLIELASMQMDCNAREGVVQVGRRKFPVTVIEYEVCTQSTFERTAPGVDPRNWTTYSPFFFDSVEVLTPAPTTPNWNGVIQEQVGALLSGKPVITNLAVSYIENNNLAAVTYDLAPDDPTLKDDDGTVKVDYGMFAVLDEGMHRRVRMLKVVHIEGRDMNHEWLCPLWAHQLAMIGWWF